MNDQNKRIHAENMNKRNCSKYTVYVSHAF